MPRRWPLILIVASMAAGCSGPANAPSALPSQPSNATSSAATTFADDPPGAVACAKAARTLRDGTVMNPGVVTEIEDAAVTADAPVLEAAEALSESYTKAVAAHGTDAEPDAVAAVSEAAARLTQVCADSGLEVVG